MRFQWTITSNKTTHDMPQNEIIKNRFNWFWKCLVALLNSKNGDGQSQKSFSISDRMLIIFVRSDTMTFMYEDIKLWFQKRICNTYLSYFRNLLTLTPFILLHSSSYTIFLNQPCACWSQNWIENSIIILLRTPMFWLMAYTRQVSNERKITQIT